MMSWAKERKEGIKKRMKVKKRQIKRNIRVKKTNYLTCTFSHLTCLILESEACVCVHTLVDLSENAGLDSHTRELFFPHCSNTLLVEPHG